MCRRCSLLLKYCCLNPLIHEVQLPSVVQSSAAGRASLSYNQVLAAQRAAAIGGGNRRRRYSRTRTARCTDPALGAHARVLGQVGNLGTFRGGATPAGAAL